MPTLLITGANRGIGFEFARQYAEDGWNVIACCRKPEKAERLLSLAKSNASMRIETLDIADDASIAALAANLKDITIDVLINNAGVFSGTGIDGKHFTEDGSDKTQYFGTIDASAWAKVLRTNTVSPIMVAQAFHNNLLRSNAGKLVMISSRMGSVERMARAGDIAYRSSKAALNSAMKNVSISLRDQKIITISFHPGWTQTDMGSVGADMTPKQSVSAMKKTISNLKAENSGQFLNFDGQVIPW